MSVAATRFGHTEGRVGVAYGKEGEKIVTIGSDGEMRVWAGVDDDDCENHLIGDEGLAVCVSEKKIFVGSSGTNVLSGYSWEGDSEGVVGPRFTADVTALHCTESGEVVVAGLADFSVKVIKTSDFSCVSLSGHAAPVLSVSMATQEDIVASSSCDGCVKVWSVESKSALQTLPNMLGKSNDVPNSKSTCGLSFSKCGQWLAVPTEEKVVVLGRSETWEKTKEIKITGLAAGEIVTTTAWDSDGGYILAGTNKGNLCLLSFPTLCLARTVHSGRRHNICALAWHPAKNEAIFADMGGHWGMVEELGGSGGDKLATTAEASNEDVEDMEALFNDDDDDENSFSIAKTVAETGYVKDDDGNLAYGNTQARPDSAQSMVSSVVEGGKVYRPPPPPKVRLQPSFQPGASPPGLSNRFLVYNSVGIVKSHHSEQENSLDIEFHDIATHHALHLSNSEGATMAALSSKILATATPGDDVVGGKLMVNYFSSGDVNKEWSIVLEEEEEIMGVAVGDKWVAVVTSKNHLRMFTAGGLQREVVMVMGPLVTMVGEGDRLLVITHGGHPLPGQQALHYNLYSVTSSLKPLNTSPLPLCPGSELYWAGFSDTKTPCTADTAGWVRALDQVTNVWHPISNTRDQVRGKSDFHYIVSISHTEFVLRGVLCKGAKYPPTIPRPLPTAIPLEVPLTATTTEKGGLEQTALNLSLQARFIQASANQGEESEEIMETVKQSEVECIMKLFALACRSDHESRAVEVASLMPSVETLQLAIKYAAKLRRVGLADKLGQLAMDLQEQQDKEEEEKQAARQGEEEEESQDMFAPTQENPLLAAAAKRDSFSKSAQPVNISTQGRQESRNPFAKRVAGGGNTGSPSQGIVFDSLEAEKVKSSPSGERTGFGQRKVMGMEKAKRPLLPKAPLIAKEKENREENGQGELLKGFQLYLAENRDSFSCEQDKVQELALTQWKGMDKELKDKYKEARLPVRSGEGGKRKRSEEDDDAEGKKMKAGSGTAKQKLAGFAFPGN